MIHQWHIILFTGLLAGFGAGWLLRSAIARFWHVAVIIAVAHNYACAGSALGTVATLARASYEMIPAQRDCRWYGDDDYTEAARFSRSVHERRCGEVGK